MQHIVNIAFDFDDKKISDSIESQVHKEVVDNITKEVKKIVENKVAEVLEENKDVIINGTIKMLADKLSRTKQVKESVSELVG